MKLSDIIKEALDEIIDDIQKNPIEHADLIYRGLASVSETIQQGVDEEGNFHPVSQGVAKSMGRTFAALLSITPWEIQSELCFTLLKVTNERLKTHFESKGVKQWAAIVPDKPYSQEEGEKADKKANANCDCIGCQIRRASELEEK